jgi:hypothetical protein
MTSLQDTIDASKAKIIYMEEAFGPDPVEGL